MPNRVALCTSVLLAVSLLLGGVFVASAQAEEDKGEEAAKLAERGQEAFDKGQYAEALGFYVKARALTGWPVMLYPIAMCEEKLGELEAAYLDFKRFVETAEPRQEQFKQLAEKKLEELEPQLRVVVRVSSSPSNAQVYVGDDPLSSARTPAELKVRPGKRRLRVVAKPGEERTVELEAQVGEIVAVSVPLTGTDEVEITKTLTAAAKARQENQKTEVPTGTVKPKVAGEIFVRANVAGASVSVDGLPVGSTPTVNHEVSVGKHEVTVERRGYATWRGRVDVPAATVTIEVTLRATDSTAGTLAKWGLAGGGVASLVAGGVFAYKAGQDKTSYDELPTKSLAERGQSRVLYAQILFGVGAAALAGSTYLFVRSGSRSSTAEIRTADLAVNEGESR